MYVCIPGSGHAAARCGGVLRGRTTCPGDEDPEPAPLLDAGPPTPGGATAAKMIAEPAGIASARSARPMQSGEDEDPFGRPVHAAEPESPTQRLGVIPGTDDHPQPGGPEEAHLAQVETDPRGVVQRL